MDDDKIMMYAGDGLFGEPFDATRWFANGMYQRSRYSDGRPGFRTVGMRRSSPPPFTDARLESLRWWISITLEQHGYIREMPGVPQSAIERVREATFDPRPQILYAGSGFEEPHVPVDSYIFYMLDHGKRYFVTMDRDPISGEITHSIRDISLKSREKEERLFGELEEKERQASRLGAPGLGASSGQPARTPVYGSAWNPPGPVVERQFAYRQLLPQVDGRDVTWRKVRGQ